MKLVVHVGAGKTGTSSIQSSLSQNSELLKKQGFFYLGMYFEALLGKQHFKHGPAVDFAHDLKEREDYFEHFVLESITTAKEKLEKTGVHTAIWSNEGLFTAITKTKTLFSRISDIVELEVVTYLRRQDSWYLSAYQQWGIKHKTYNGRVKSFEDWYNEYHDSGDYYKILKDWEENVGNEHLNVRIYEKCDNVVGDFYSLLKINNDQFANVESANQSQSNTFISLYKMYNNCFDEQKLPHDLQRFISRTGLGTANLDIDSLHIDYPSDKELEKVLCEFAETNSKLDEFSKSDYKVEFPNGPASNGKDGQVNVASVNAALLFALVQVEKKVTSLHRRIVELETKLK